MTIAITYSRATIGITSPIVTVETHITSGLPRFNIVGLPETVVKESKDRVRSAIINSHFDFPLRRITVNLGPADLPKYGSRYDLAIAMGILAASGQIPKAELSRYEFVGELALSGEIRHISGILPFAIGTKKSGKSLILPYANAWEASLIEGIELLAATSLLDVCGHMVGSKKLSMPVTARKNTFASYYPDVKDVKGQHQAKRALEIVAAGDHSLLFIGPPGVGKTLLSNCLPGILPPLTETEAVELAAIHSISNIHLDSGDWQKRPFRSPHHTASSYALIGGGNPPKPGEISLAHHGVLFLDELPEFRRQALEALREPLESRMITISRANFQVEYPAAFQLIAAMNPCPCGHHGNPHTECGCSPDQIKKYQSRLSGPLLDRIDVQSELQALPTTFLSRDGPEEESSLTVARRVQAARTAQLKRSGKYNAYLTHAEVKDVCSLEPKDQVFLEGNLKEKRISARSYHKLLKIARTIADLAMEPKITRNHIIESFLYRHLERLKRF